MEAQELQPELQKSRSVMTRCDYDGIFYRVFCITLLLIAFTFTMILTNVFVDIDDLLAKEKEKPQDKSKAVSSAPQYQDVNMNHEVMRNDILYRAGEEVSVEQHVHDAASAEDSYRTKRSINVPNLKFRLTDPSMKELLNNKLSSLLEKLDAEESQVTNSIEKQKKKDPREANYQRINEEKDKNSKQDEDVLHQAMHNILLQGIIGHMDLNDVYKRVHSLIVGLEQDDKTETPVGPSRRSMAELAEIPMDIPTAKPDDSQELIVLQNQQSVESRFFDELVKCKELQKEIKNVAYKKAGTRRSGSKREDYKELAKIAAVDGSIYDQLIKCEELQSEILNTMADKRRKKKYHNKALVPKLLIKTTIDIRTLKTDKNNTNFNANSIKGLIKLIYNGTPIKFSRMDDEEDTKKEILEVTTEAKLENQDDINKDVNLALNEEGNVVDNFLDQALSHYLKKYPKLESKVKQIKKRTKRNSKVKERVHSHNNAHNKTRTKHKKKNEDELFVEIETHFDSKGLEGEKKKKLIKKLVEKIRNAIRTNFESLPNKHEKKVLAEPLQIKKRIQDSLKSLTQKLSVPIERMVVRQSIPISKSINPSEVIPKFYNAFGDIWKAPPTGPEFLSNSKAINAGEMGIIDLDYSKVLKDNGIPQRLQKPLSSDNIEASQQEESEDSNVYNLGDLKFYVKEIDGTGFSIGFNQYVGDAPDPESIKLFTGLQQLIKVYHQNYDGDDGKNDINIGYRNRPEEYQHEISKRDVTKVEEIEPIFEIPAKEVDHTSNEYKVLLDKLYLPYDSYSQIFEDGRKKISLNIEKENNEKVELDPKNSQLDSIFSIPYTIERKISKKNALPFIMERNLFNKNLKPAEIFSIADLLNTRRKRSPLIQVQKYSNLNIRGKSHISRFLNTRTSMNRMVQRKTKRAKRQLDKIRIIATDGLPHMTRNSDENFFVVSDEKIFSDRGMMREVDMPEEQPEAQEEQNAFIFPHHLFDQSSLQISPYTGRSRHNALTSKYPHLFLEEVGQSKEEDPLFYTKLIDSYGDFRRVGDSTQSPYGIMTPPAYQEQPSQPPSEREIYAIQEPKPNYKLTVKIMPKNHTDLPSGFKEIHTSINKTINKNGLRFLSQVNVSHISKIVNLEEERQQQLHHHAKQTDPSAPVEAEKENNETNQVSETNSEVPTIKPSTFPLVKQIKEQQEKMQQLLKQHKQRIDEQLNNLKLEKQNIDSMMDHENANKITMTLPETTSCATENSTSTPLETIDVVLPLNPPQILHLNKNEAGHLIANALMKLHNTPNLNDITENKLLSTTTPEPETEAPKITTVVQPTTLTECNQDVNQLTESPKQEIDSDRVKILKTIQRNENLTNAILYKIDRNTNLLQHFLQKLTDRLEPVTRKPKEWKQPQQPFFPHTMPNLEVNKNSTHVSIPFVYAYQQPYPLPPNPNHPVASVVYQGHIHTNAYNGNFNNNKPRDYKEQPRNLVPEKREVNRTKFFLDDLDNGFKVVPMPVRKEPYEISRIKSNINVTHDFRRSN